MKRSDGFGYVQGDDKQTLFDSNDLVWAVGKTDKGVGYQLNQDKYENLVAHVQCARDLVDRTSRFLRPMKSSDPFLNKDGTLTSVGLVADHFNLIRLRKIEAKAFFPGPWKLSVSQQPEVQQGDLQVLLDTVRKVLQATKNGLNSRLLLRGKGNQADVAKAGGYVVRRNNRVGGEGANFPKTMPELGKDKIFNNPLEQARGHIHVDYKDIAFPCSVDRGLARSDTCMTWTLIHEVTHKFARTRDVDSPNCYDFNGCRRMQWTEAVRNAKHYQILCGLDWGSINWPVASNSTFMMKNQDLVGDQK